MLNKAIKTFVENYGDDIGVTVELRWLNGRYDTVDDSLFGFVLCDKKG